MASPSIPATANEVNTVNAHVENNTQQGEKGQRSRSDYLTVNLYLEEVWRVKKVAKENIKKVRESLEKLYDEYVTLSLEESSSMEVDNGDNNPTSSTSSNSSFMSGFDQILSMVREKEAVPPMKSELHAYLDEGIYITDNKNDSFSALEWWRNNNMKYKVLPKMAADILAISISTVTSEFTFSVGDRVIDEYRSRLNEESIGTLICGGDLLHHKYSFKKKPKVGTYWL
ncbi:Zinc finger BED domain-containing protein RICESLEEPER 1 [Glycine max]|nr:Zinc finger BED domain-containing protein RICESLEEPER 1 [Glycine max]